MLFFEIIKVSQFYTLVATNNEEAVHHAVSFASANTFIGLPQMKAYTSINIRFQFRTFESNGLLMYNAGSYLFRTFL